MSGTTTLDLADFHRDGTKVDKILPISQVTHLGWFGGGESYSCGTLLKWNVESLTVVCALDCGVACWSVGVGV